MKVVRVRLQFLRWTGSVPQRWTSMREGSNTTRWQCSAWNVELSAIRRAKILASRESGCRVAHSRQVVRCHPMETLEHLDADSETDAISNIQPVQNVTPNVRQASVILASVRHQTQYTNNPIYHLHCHCSQISHPKLPSQASESTSRV